MSPGDLAHGAPPGSNAAQVVALDTGTVRRHPGRLPVGGRRAGRGRRGARAGRGHSRAVAALADGRRAPAPAPDGRVPRVDGSAVCDGNWGPELVALAGGTCALGVAGRPLDDAALAGAREADPDVIVVAPCGFGVERTLAEMPALAAHPEWRDAGGGARRPRLRRRRQPLLQSLGAAAVRHARDPRRDPAPGGVSAGARGRGLAPLALAISRRATASPAKDWLDRHQLDRVDVDRAGQRRHP